MPQNFDPVRVVYLFLYVPLRGRTCLRWSQISRMEPFVKKVYIFKLFTISAKNSILPVWLSSEYTCATKKWISRNFSRSLDLYPISPLLEMLLPTQMLQIEYDGGWNPPQLVIYNEKCYFSLHHNASSDIHKHQHSSTAFSPIINCLVSENNFRPSSILL